MTKSVQGLPRGMVGLAYGAVDESVVLGHHAGYSMPAPMNFNLFPLVPGSSPDRGVAAGSVIAFPVMNWGYGPFLMHPQMADMKQQQHAIVDGVQKRAHTQSKLFKCLSPNSKGSVTSPVKDKTLSHHHHHHHHSHGRHRLASRDIARQNLKRQWEEIGKEKAKRRDIPHLSSLHRLACSGPPTTDLPHTLPPGSFSIPVDGAAVDPSAIVKSTEASKDLARRHNQMKMEMSLSIEPRVIRHDLEAECEQPLICRICDDKATGLHYGIITCEG